MPGWLFLVAFVVVYLLPTQWLLPETRGLPLEGAEAAPVPA